MKVWILTAGEDHAGGRVDSVYAERELAAGRFLELAKDLSERFRLGLDVPVSAGDGSLYIHSGCDWVSLDPHDLVGQLAIEPQDAHSCDNCLGVDPDTCLYNGAKEH